MLGACLAALVATTGCGGGGGGDGGDSFDDAFNEASGAGGGGTLTVEGSDYPIESVMCANSDSRVDIGTVGQNYRVFVTGDPDDPDLQILDPDSIQWFDGDKQQNNEAVVAVDGDTYTSEPTVWWNNQDDRVIEAYFTIECP